MHAHDTVVQVCSVPQCAKIHYCTHTYATCFGNTVGLLIPMFNPMQSWVHILGAASTCHKYLSDYEISNFP